jgi:hypothetical protein
MYLQKSCNPSFNNKPGINMEKHINTGLMDLTDQDIQTTYDELLEQRTRNVASTRNLREAN